MHVLHIAPIDFSGHSGLSTVIPEIIEHQNKRNNFSATLLLSKKVDKEVIKKQENSKHFRILDYSYAKEFQLNRLLSILDSIDLVIFHSTYIPLHYKISKILRENNIPYILVPHGGMTKYAHNRKRIKKKIGDYLFFNKLIRYSERIQYLSEEEAKNSSFWGKKYFVVPNAISQNSESTSLDTEAKHPFIFTSISRLDIANKGLDIQIEAISKIKGSFLEHNAQMHIYGPSINGSRKNLDDMVKELDLGNIVFIHDPVYGEEKNKVLKVTSVFTLLSKSEGQSMGVLEALSMGIPCLITPGVNLNAVIKRYKFGWLVQDNSDSVAKTMKNILENKVLAPSLGINGIEFVDRFHNWDQSTNLAIENYNEIIDR